MLGEFSVHLLLRIAPKDRETGRRRKFAVGRDCLLKGKKMGRDVEKMETNEVVMIVEVAVFKMMMVIVRANEKIVLLLVIKMTTIMMKITADVGTYH